MAAEAAEAVMAVAVVGDAPRMSGAVVVAVAVDATAVMAAIAAAPAAVGQLLFWRLRRLRRVWWRLLVLD